MSDVLLFLFLALILHTLLFPMILVRLSSLTRKPMPCLPQYPQGPRETWPFVSVLIPIHNTASMLTEKLMDIFESDYPNHRMEILLVLDGDVQGTDKALEQYRASIGTSGPEIRRIQCERVGKNIALTTGAKAAKGEILLITDADARLRPLAITRLIAAIQGEDVGGGCGQHLILSDVAHDRGAQQTYWSMESKIKSSEMHLLGSVTASYGTIIAIKHQVFLPIPPGVTDDHFIALSVVAQGFCFVYAPDAIVEIEKPSVTLITEIQRKRRIVTQSFRSLWAWRRLLSPFRSKGYAICLWTHKVLRRLLPVFFLMVFGTSCWLHLQGSKIGHVLLVFQAICYGLSLFSFVLVMAGKKLPRPFRLAAYFLAGNIGMLLGTIDALRGKKVVMW